MVRSTIPVIEVGALPIRYTGLVAVSDNEGGGGGGGGAEFMC
jgi:hypothetical protein